ncbi:MAG: hypothetical protein CMB80_27990 [Flammeovirgaceae bacterium]|nr:hypothetical protein [Flammeovirgaceae bacterium]MBE63185.1 hypothetical protein [Flammeovirgaceae bacterium]HCX24962.1 hypothetical protein [Cytophagales bacterium]
MNWKWILLCLGSLGFNLAFGGNSGSISTTIIIDELPANTPHDASIYLATDFDGWFPDIPKRKFKHLPDGTLYLLLKHDQDTINYKITRGSWASVEARDDGRALPNRIIISAGKNQTVHLRIETWEDISLGLYTVYMIFLAIAGFQGLLLIGVINTIRNKNKQANTVLSVLLLLITVSLFGRAAILDPRVFNWQPKLVFLPELILFSYGPAFYLYVHKLLRLKINKRYFLHFIPSVVQVGLYLPFLIAAEQEIIYELIDKKLFPYFAITGTVALLFNFIYWYLSKQLVSAYVIGDHSNERQKRYLKFLETILTIKSIYLLLWLTAVLIFVVGEFTKLDTISFVEDLIDGLWLLFSLIIFTLAYYALKYPELLQVKKKYQDNSINEGEATQIKDRLINALKVDKIYLKADLTLDSAAHLIPTASHTLSRVINEQFDQNFTELINGYRINAFIDYCQKNPDESYLEVALKVGFNSKPTFNRAFKKLKGCTPREYFKQA